MIITPPVASSEAEAAEMISVQNSRKSSKVSRFLPQCLYSRADATLNSGAGEAWEKQKQHRLNVTLLGDLALALKTHTHTHMTQDGLQHYVAGDRN